MTQRMTAALANQRVAKALAHPLRAHVLTILNKRVASPNELANELDASLSMVDYHVKLLAEMGCIELVRTEPKRGATEHFYRAVVRPFFSDTDWARLPPSARQGISDVCLQMIWEDASDALDAATFDARSDRHLSRSPLVLDERGWRDLNARLTELLEDVVAIESESAERIAQAGAEGFNTKLMVMHFESAGPKPKGEPTRSGKRRG